MSIEAETFSTEMENLIQSCKQNTKMLITEFIPQWIKYMDINGQILFGRKILQG